MTIKTYDEFVNENLDNSQSVQESAVLFLYLIDPLLDKIRDKIRDVKSKRLVDKLLRQIGNDDKQKAVVTKVKGVNIDDSGSIVDPDADFLQVTIDNKDKSRFWVYDTMNGKKLFTIENSDGGKRLMQIYTDIPNEFIEILRSKITK